MNLVASSAAPLPANETARLAALRALQVLDADAEPAFDLVVEQAALVCGVPTALISLVDDARQWFLARHGMAERETPRDVSFCAHAILQADTLEVADARDDPRFAHNPMVTGESGIRFYAGVPIVLAQGAAVGTLCAIAPHAHRLDATQRRQLEGLARLVAGMLQARAERLALAAELATSDARYRAMVEDQTDLVALVDAADNLRYANRALGDLIAETPAALSGCALTAFAVDADRAALRGQLRLARERGTVVVGEARVRSASGALHWIEWKHRAVTAPGADGTRCDVHSVGRDITDRKSLERELLRSVTEREEAHEAVQAQHEQLRVTLHSIGDAVITTDDAGRVRYLNPVAERLTGWSDADARGHRLEDVYRTFDENSREPLPNPVAASLVEGAIVATDAAASVDAPLPTLVSRHGAEAGVEQTVAPICAADGRVLGAVLVFRDVTDRRRMTREMSYRATHDSLTGLVNRADFESRLQHTLRLAHVDGSVHALMYIDLDQFKVVNDACGHAAGDQLLRQVAALLKQSIRTRDTLARLGGDEFGVILQFCSLEQGQRVAQQICDRMDEYRFAHGDRRFRVGTSIGLVPLDSRWPGGAAVMQAADAACYAAKEGGRNRVHAWFDADLNLRLRQGDMQWVARLEQAIDEDRFELFAQRIEPLRADAAGLHFEVLLRLRGPDGQLVQPGAFLPAAERFHLATRIDHWVVRSVVDWMARRRETLGHVGTVAVNLSGQSISDPAFLRQVSEIVEGARFDPRKLCFEVTETAAITNMADATAFVDAMREHGIRFALDDFGAGASGFSSLKTLRVDYIKIDGQFIRGLQNDPLDRVTVQSFRDVAAVVGTRTIAEFVENEATAALLREIGIDYAQGYLYHRPEPIDVVVGAP